MFKIPNRPAKPEPVITIGDKEIEVRLIPDRSVTIEQYDTIRTNSDGWRALFPKLNDECLDHVTRRYRNNCQQDQGVTYDQAVIHQIVPELLKRLKEYEERLDEVHSVVDNLYSEGPEVRLLPVELSHASGPISVIHKVSDLKKPYGPM